MTIPAGHHPCVRCRGHYPATAFTGPNGPDTMVCDLCELADMLTRNPPCLCPGVPPGGARQPYRHLDFASPGGCRLGHLLWRRNIVGAMDSP